ncbi:SAF domain-containing protein [Flaviflexus massiliensis]|uniref:SAF domain-containing protein n=1 Tax=Flaviflexus massiliensis TaxID=1522309 RepID=UPI0009E738C6|nr:SAF domain-containing protein [Flaviflexus massiliensis]
MSSKPSVRAMLWRWRKLLTATFLALCLALVVASIGSSGRVMMAELAVASRSMPAGHVISEEDITLVQAPSGLIPADKNVDDLQGRRLAVAIPEGTPLTSSMVIGPTLSDGAPEGTVVVPLYLATPKDLIPVGSVVMLLALTEEGNAIEVATHATILAFSDAEAAPSSMSDSDNLVYAYVAIDVEHATFVLGMSARAPLFAVLQD